MAGTSREKSQSVKDRHLKAMVLRVGFPGQQQGTYANSLASPPNLWSQKLEVGLSSQCFNKSSKGLRGTLKFENHSRSPSPPLGWMHKGELRGEQIGSCESKQGQRRRELWAATNAMMWPRFDLNSLSGVENWEMELKAVIIQVKGFQGTSIPFKGKKKNSNNKLKILEIR